MALERLAPLPGDGEGGEPSPRSRPLQPTPSGPVWASAAQSPALASQPQPGRKAPARGSTTGRGAGPKTWPTPEERAERQQAKEAARSAEVAHDPVGVARDTCLRLLEFRPRTRMELARALAKRGVPEEVAEQVLGRFAEVGMIDDALFASLWVSSRHRGRGLAGRALSLELRRKGVDDEVIRAAVDELDPETEVDTARALVRRKLPSTQGLATQVRIRRLVAMLARKGYGAGTAFRVVKQELEREGASPLELSTEELLALE